MTKKQEALDKARESWKKITEWWKELWKWTAQIVVWTSWAIGYTLASWYEKWASMVSEIRENEEWISENERKKHRDNSEKYNEKAKIHIAKAWKFGKTAIKWTWKALKWWAKVIWHAVKWGYHLIDAWDKAIWEKIEKKQLEKWKHPWKATRFLRDNVLKLLIALSATGYGWYKVSQLLPDKQEDKVEVVQGLTETEQFVKDFFKSPDVMKDLKSSGKEWQKKWEDRYLWEDEAWNNMWDGFWYAERNKVIEWMCRMIESWDLEMVLKKADEAWVPRQCVFLALAESWWQAWADSWVAWWYWQFTRDSGKLFWLIDSEWNDYRWDPEKSTDAAMKHLQENYKIVSNYARQLRYNLSESDKWMFAFYMYNWSPKLVRKWMESCKWNANEYSEKLQAKKKENNNYVPRILGIQDALEKTFRENWYNTQKIRTVCLNQKQVQKTEADLMYEEFLKQSELLSQEERLKKLDEVKEKYEKEYEEWLITKAYYEWAIRVIGDAIIWENRDDEDAEE